MAGEGGAISSHKILPEDTNVEAVQRRVMDGEDDFDCPICFDSMNINSSTTCESLTYCRSACGMNFHTNCIIHWLKNCPTQSCPNCRQEWVGPENKKKLTTSMSTSTSTVATSFPNDNNYMNLAEIQGISRVRDTSTYNPYFTSPERSRTNTQSNKRRRHGY